MSQKTIIQFHHLTTKSMYFLSSQKFKMQTHFNSRSQMLNNVKENTLQSYNKITQMRKATLPHKKEKINWWPMLCL